MTGQPFTLLVDIPLTTGRADEFMALLNDVFEAMKVEETLVSATALRGTEDPDTILLCENWIDRENLSVQLKRRYRDRYEARLPELLRSPRKLVLLRADPLRPIAVVAKGGVPPTVMGLHRQIQIGRPLRLAIYRQLGGSFCRVLLTQACVGSWPMPPEFDALFAAARTWDTLTSLSLMLP